MQPRPRVLAVAQSPNLGGAELALLRLARLLPERGFDVVAAVPAPGPLAAALSAEGFETALLPIGGLGRGEWRGAVGGWPRGAMALRRFRPDVVWLNGVVTLRAVPGLLGDTPFVPYLHDILHRPPRLFRSSRFWARTPTLLCAARAVADAVERVGAPSERLRVVWAPVERPAPVPQPAWVGDGQEVIGFVGRIEPRKGTVDLLEAFRLLRERRPNVRLVIAGESEAETPSDYRHAVDRAVAALGDSVTLLGRVDDAASLMRWFDVLAVPSREEPFGTVAAEALAAGTPVVATRSGGISEYLRPGEDGELVEPAAPEQLAAALDAVLCRAARPQPRNPFEPGRIADLVAQAFREATR